MTLPPPSMVHEAPSKRPDLRNIPRTHDEAERMQRRIWIKIRTLHDERERIDAKIARLVERQLRVGEWKEAMKGEIEE